jgi:hypothetical protein
MASHLSTAFRVEHRVLQSEGVLLGIRSATGALWRSELVAAEHCTHSLAQVGVSLTGEECRHVSEQEGEERWSGCWAKKATTETMTQLVHTERVMQWSSSGAVKQ